MQKTVFFDKKCVNKKKIKPKPIVFYIYLCSKYIPTEDSSNDLGAWSSLITKQTQETIVKTKEIKNRSSYMLSSVLYGNHIRMRLFGVKESLEWIVSSIPEDSIQYIEVNFTSNDVYIVNLLKEWIPKWAKTNFMKDDNEGQRPNSDLMIDIAKISEKIKMTLKWQNENNFEMVNLCKKVDELLEENKDADKSTILHL